MKFFLEWDSLDSHCNSELALVLLSSLLSVKHFFSSFHFECFFRKKRERMALEINCFNCNAWALHAGWNGSLDDDDGSNGPFGSVLSLPDFSFNFWMVPVLSVILNHSCISQNKQTNSKPSWNERAPTTTKGNYGTSEQTKKHANSSLSNVQKVDPREGRENPIGQSLLCARDAMMTNGHIHFFQTISRLIFQALAERGNYTFFVAIKNA